MAAQFDQRVGKILVLDVDGAARETNSMGLGQHVDVVVTLRRLKLVTGQFQQLASYRRR